MIIIEDECVGCPTEMGCLGSACPNINVKYYVCDDCRDYIDKLYNYEGRELCLSCIEKLLEVVE